jgi:hypothetical protein
LSQLAGRKNFKSCIRGWGALHINIKHLQRRMSGSKIRLPSYQLVETFSLAETFSPESPRLGDLVCVATADRWRKLICRQEQGSSPSESGHHIYPPENTHTKPQSQEQSCGSTIDAGSF